MKIRVMKDEGQYYVVVEMLGSKGHALVETAWERRHLHRRGLQRAPWQAPSSAYRSEDFALALESAICQAAEGYAKLVAPRYAKDNDSAPDGVDLVEGVWIDDERGPLE